MRYGYGHHLQRERGLYQQRGEPDGWDHVTLYIITGVESIDITGYPSEKIVRVYCGGLIKEVRQVKIIQAVRNSSETNVQVQVEVKNTDYR